MNYTHRVGGTPFLLQYLMTYLWNRIPSGLTSEDVYAAVNVFFETRPDFRHWCTSHLRDQDITVYGVISRIKSVSVGDLERMMLTAPSPAGDGRRIPMDAWMIRDSLNTLHWAGLIRRVEPDAYELSGEMFHRWFLSYHSRKSAQEGGTRMTIEQDALQVAGFLRSLREQIIAHPQFGQVYGEVGSIDQEVTRLASALTLNYDRLQEARHNLALYPGRRQYQDDVDTYLQGLSATTLEIEKLWRQFRADALTGTESLIIRVEQEAPKQRSFDSILAGLRKFKNFLVVALDIKKALVEWSPMLVEAVRVALDQLGKISLPW